MRRQGFWRRWLGRIGIGLCGLLMLLVAAGAAFEQIARWLGTRAYPPPGKMVDIGARRMQINCLGQGSPTVVFESGAGPLGGLDWGNVQRRIAAFTRACSYSRAGELWSDPARTPLTAKRVAQDLHATLVAAGEKPPYVLVGHSIGGPYIVTYTGLYPDEVAGLVLVDPAYPDEFVRLAAIVGPANAGFNDILRPLRVANALDWTGLARLLFSARAQDPKLPPGAGATGVAWLFRTLPTLVDEYEQAPAILLESGQYRNFGSRPVIVLSSGIGSVPYAAQLGITRDQAERSDQAWLSMNKEEASWSTRGQQRTVTGAEHAIQLDRPQAVIAAIQDVIVAVTTK